MTLGHVPIAYSPTPVRRRVRTAPLTVAVLGVAVLGALVLVSLAVGSNPLSLDQVWKGLVQQDASRESLIVWQLRMPRTALALVVGAALAVAGVVMQALTRNPLAEPGILGVNAGAAFMVVLSMSLLGITAFAGYLWFALGGAALAAGFVYAISIRRTHASDHARLVLAGTALTLGSPDIIGFTTGAATGGLLVILITGGTTAAGVALGTLIGGAATAVVVVLISLRRGLRGDRLVLTGIAIAAMLAAVNDYVLSRAPIEQAEAAKAWQFGSLNAISWGPLPALAVVLALAVPAALIHGRLLRVLELGDDAAAGVGLSLTRTRIVAVGIGVTLAALAVATAGPIGFLALAAPQLAARLSHSPGVSILASATMGGLILVVADLGAQRVLSPFQIPVGLVTAAIGGAYLVWMLVFASPRRT